MEEEIRIIDGTDGRYGVSNLGNVYSFFKENRLLHQSKHPKTGYMTVNWIENGKHKRYTVHRLVAIMFLPNPDNLPCVNHKNEDKTDNRVENLEWCTYKYNSNYGTCRDKLSEQKIGDKNPSYKKVCPLVLYTQYVVLNRSSNEIAKDLGICNTNVYRKLNHYNITRKEEH